MPGVGRTAATAAWTADAVPRSVGVLREHARAFAREHGADDAALHRIALAVSEAAANAVLHAYVDLPSGPIDLRCEAGPGEVRVSLTDHGRGMQPRGDSPGMGLGLSTMGRLAERLDVRAGPDGRGTTVRLTFRAPGVRGAVLLRGDDPGDRLLVAASDLARSAAWPQEGFERLCDLVLGDFADVATVDVAEHGTLRRLAARVDGDDALSAWLATSTPPVKPGTATWDAVQRGEARLIVHDPSSPRSPGGPGERLGLGWWLAVPLADGDDVLAVLGMGGRGGRPPPPEATIALAVEAGRRAAGGLANATVLAAMQTTRQRLEAVLAALDEAVSVSDPTGRIHYANALTAELLGAADLEEVQAAQGRAWFERYEFTDEHGEELGPDAFPSRRLLRGEEAPPLLTRAVERLTGRTRWLRIRSHLLDDPEGPLVVNVTQDVTDVVAAEQRRRAAVAVGELLDVPPEARADLQRVAELLVPGIADGCAIDVLDAGGVLRRVALAHPDAEQRERLERLQERWPTSEDPPTLAVLDGAPRVVATITDAYLRARASDDEQLELLLAIGLRSVVVVPLRAGGRSLGTLTLAQDRRSGRRLGDEDVTFAVDLARRIGTALLVAEVTGVGR